MVSKVSMVNAKQNFNFSARQDTTADLVLKGNSEFLRDSLRVNLDSLYLRYEGFGIANDSNLVLKFDPSPQK